MTQLEKEDYEEPRCALCMKKPGAPRESLPIRRILIKLDQYLEKEDLENAEKHLLFWVEEAKKSKDLRAESTLHNELMGLYRKKEQKENAIFHAEKALSISEVLGQKGNLSYAMILLNAATVYACFSEHEKAMSYFEIVESIYEKELKMQDTRFAALYNNMADSLMKLQKAELAKDYYKKAISIGENAGGCAAWDAAMSCLNLAELLEHTEGLVESEEEISSYLEKAYLDLQQGDYKNSGYYAYVCTKCLDAFHYYGFFLYAKKLEERVRSFYERT